MNDIYRPFAKFGQIYLPKLKGNQRKGVQLTYPIRTKNFDRSDVQFKFTAHYNPITNVQSLVVDAHGLTFDLLLDDALTHVGVSGEVLFVGPNQQVCGSPRTLLRPTKYYRDKFSLPPYFCSYDLGRTMETSLYMVIDGLEDAPERILLRMTLVDIANETYMVFDAKGNVNIVFNANIADRVHPYHVNDAFEPVITNQVTCRPLLY